MVGRHWLRWSAALVFALAGGAAAIVKAFGLAHWTWLAVTATAVAAVMILPAKVAAARVEARAKRTFEVRDTLTTQAIGGGCLRVRDVADPTRLGVHPAGFPEGKSHEGLAERVPLYVRRDQHEAMVSRLKPGAFVLIRGDSCAGKSRLAFEALRASAGRHLLFAPEPEAVGAAIERMRQVRWAVLWLDDLDRFLDADTATATAISELLAGQGHQRMVVATLRHQAHEALTAQPEGAAEGVVDRRQRVLELADHVLIGRAFTTTEIDRARQLRTDPRIDDALTRAEFYGVAEYMAAGPQLRDKWLSGQETRPRGAALVAAAVDCRRAGFIAPLPTALLDEIHTHYLPTNPRTPIEELDAAWTWATETWRNTAALLERTNTDNNTVIVFDYLVDHVQRTSPVDNDPPEHILLNALDHTDTTTASAIGAHAHQRGRYNLAHAAYTRIHTRHSRILGENDPDTLYSRSKLAQVLGDQGKLDEAEAEHRTVLTHRTRTLGEIHPDTLTSRNNLATILLTQGKLDQAEILLREVLTHRSKILGENHPKTLTSRNNLAGALLKQGKFDQAQSELRAVLDISIEILGKNHPHTLASRNNLGTTLHRQGKLTQAEDELHTVLTHRTHTLGENHPDTLTSRNNLALLLCDQGKLDQAEDLLRNTLAAIVENLGENHPHTVAIRKNLDIVLRKKGTGLDREDP